MLEASLSTVIRVPEELRTVLATLDPPLPPTQAARMGTLFNLLREWRRAGITGFSGPDALARYYFLEALELRRFLPPAAGFLDVGSGGGTPALPLALTGSGHWTLLEPRRRAAAFLEIAAGRLGLAPRLSVVRKTLQHFLNSPEGTAALGQTGAVTLRAVKLRRGEWKGLARALTPRTPVIWPTSRAARERAAIPPRLYHEEIFEAARGIVWIGRPVRKSSDDGRPEPAS